MRSKQKSHKVEEWRERRREETRTLRRVRDPETRPTKGRDPTEESE